jgi:hypothetical protein
MRRWLLLFWCAALLQAQSPRPETPEPLLNEVETSILNRDLVAAYDSAARLDDTVQAMLRASQSRDAASVANQMLTWLPPASEAFIFDQRPFVVGERAPRPDVAILTSRLARLNGGAVLGALRGSTVRLAAAGGSAPAAVAWFYLFDAGVNPRLFGNPELLILGRPFWRGDSLADLWFTLARPDLLVVASGRDLAAAIVGRVLNGSSTRALPPTLPEWSEVDRQAPLWGLAHFGSSAEIHGITLSLDAAQKLEIRCECPTRPPVPQADFQSAQPRRGLWVLHSDLGSRGEAPLFFALGLLGLGDTR